MRRGLHINDKKYTGEAWKTDELTSPIMGQITTTYRQQWWEHSITVIPAKNSSAESNQMNWGMFYKIQHCTGESSLVSRKHIVFLELFQKEIKDYWMQYVILNHFVIKDIIGTTDKWCLNNRWQWYINVKVWNYLKTSVSPKYVE